MNCFLILVAALAAPEIYQGPPGFVEAATGGKLPPTMVSAWPTMGWPGGFAMVELVIEGDERPLEGASLDIGEPYRSVAAPEVYEHPGEGDVLRRPPDTWDMPAAARRAFLLVYRIPPDAKPGRHSHSAWLRASNRPRSQEVPLTLAVADVSASTMRVLPAQGKLAWPPSGTSLGKDGLRQGLELWRLTPALLWPEAESTSQPLRPEDMDLFMAAQARDETMAPLNLGALLPQETSAPREFNDYLRVAKLERWTPWVRNVLWASGVQAEIPVTGGIDAEATLLGRIEQYRQVLPGANLMLVGPFVPDLQGRAEAWALPENQLSRLAPRLGGGLGAANASPCTLELLGASPGIALPEWPSLLTRASDALDGVPETAWCPSPLESAWLELGNPSGLRIESITLLGDMKPPRAITAFGNQPPSESSITWREERPGEQVGTFRYPGPFERLRLEFPDTRLGTLQPRLSELVINTPAAPETSETFNPMAPWVLLQPDAERQRSIPRMLAAEASGAVGFHLGTWHMATTDDETAGVAAYLEGDQYLPSLAAVFTMLGLQEATLVRALRAQGKLPSSQGGALAIAASAASVSAEDPSQSIEALRAYHELRATLIKQLAD